MSTIPQRQIREEQKPLSVGEYSKGKINEHYEQVLRLRKELSQRECHWGKQKTNLMSKIQIMNLQNGQIKQRLTQLSKVNHTLQLALSTKDESQNRSRKDDLQWQALQQQLDDKIRINKQLRKVTQDLKRKVVAIQTEKNNLQQSLNQRINSLLASNRQQSEEIDRKYAQLKKQLTSLPFAKDALTYILRIVNNCLTNQQLSFQDLSSEFDSPSCKPLIKNFQNRQKIQDNSFSRISCHSIISELNNNSNNPNYEQSDEEETEKLLCQDCKRVFDQKSFISHMEECSRTKLQKNRQKIEKDLLNIDSQHRKSLSQLKKKNTIQYEPVLKELSPIQNKMQKKAKGSDGYESANQFSRLVNQYRSNKYY